MIVGEVCQEMRKEARRTGERLRQAAPQLRGESPVVSHGMPTADDAINGHDGIGCDKFEL